LQVAGWDEGGQTAPSPGAAMARIGLRVRFRSQAPLFWHGSAFVSDSAGQKNHADKSHLAFSQVDRL